MSYQKSVAWLAAAVTVFAVLGAAAGYSYLYVFHLVLIPWLALLLLGILLHGTVVFSFITFFFVLFYISALITFFWVGDLSFYGRNIVYLSFAFVLVLGIPASIYSEGSLNKIIILFVIVGGVQVFIGVAESLGLFRLPMSPYSQYYYIFGRDNSFILNWSEPVRLYNMAKPTGFSGNPNTFGFAVLLVAPFFCFSPFLWVRVFAFVVFFYLFYVVDSKSLFLSMILMYFLYFALFDFHRALRAAPVFLVSIILVLFLISQYDSDARILTVFSAIHEGVEAIADGGGGDDSTGYRAYLYSYAFKQFIDSYGFGVGVGGMESVLYGNVGEHVALHNFYLQILADLGWVGFLFFLLFQGALLVGLYKLSRCQSKRVSYFARSMFLAILVSVFSSIAPSGIFYNLNYWLLLGLSSAFVMFYKKKYSFLNLTRNCGVEQ